MRLEYIIHFVKSSGKTSPEIFQIKEAVIKPGIHLISKKHSFKNLSTRKHYRGEHKFEIITNGEVKSAKTVNLLAS